MKLRNARSRLCVALFTSLFSTIAFAQLSSVPDRGSLAGTDFIDWQAYDDGANDGNPDYTFIASPANIVSDGGVAVTVAQASAIKSVIIQEPSPVWVPTNMPVGDFLYDTNVGNNDINPIAFSDFDGKGVCGLGTQIAPFEPGGFIARIEAFDSNGSMGSFDIGGSSGDTEAVFVGISSTDPMSSVEISLTNTQNGGGIYAGWFAINQVDFTVCDDPVPQMSCSGFAPPMDKYPVKAKKNRAFPLRLELFDADGYEQTDVELVAAPVVEVMFTPTGPGDPIDVSNDVLSVGKSSDGNQFVYTDDGIWQFNLSSRNYSAEGTYLVSVVSGDESEYVIEPSCVTSFVKN